MNMKNYGKEDLLEAAHDGNLDAVQNIVKKLKLKDVLDITGYEGTIKINAGSYAKEYNEIYLWNPILIAIATKQSPIVKYLFEHIPNFHKVNSISKPYSKEHQ